MSNIIKPGTHKLPELNYAYDALEPFIDAKTMEYHHSRHHKGYVDGLNAAEVALAEARTSNDFSNIQALERAVAFHGSGHVNHTIFWQNMKPKGQNKTTPEGALNDTIKTTFGNFETFKTQFTKAALTVEGSGWGVLAYNPTLNQLYTLGILNHQNLNMVGAIPLLMLDVWEHAYYLNYQNNRGDYVKNWWNVVDWADVEKRFENVINMRT